MRAWYTILPVCGSGSRAVGAVVQGHASITQTWSLQASGMTGVVLCLPHNSLKNTPSAFPTQSLYPELCWPSPAGDLCICCSILPYQVASSHLLLRAGPNVARAPAAVSSRGLSGGGDCQENTEVTLPVVSHSGDRPL